jgi:hypothetical protein
MPKKKSYPYRLGKPKTENPLKEMSWCVNKHIFVSCKIQGFKVGGQWEMGDKYCLTVKQGDRYKESEYIYDKNNIVDAIYDTYRFIYERNYGKEREEPGN